MYLFSKCQASLYIIMYILMSVSPREAVGYQKISFTEFKKKKKYNDATDYFRNNSHKNAVNDPGSNHSRLAFIKLQMLPLKNICSYTDAVCGLKTNQKIKILQRDTSCGNMQTKSQQQNSKD